MENYEVPGLLTHKKQRKANDCWYASIQMLRTWKENQTTKPKGDHTKHLHKGILGHTLRASAVESKHFTHVLTENNLKCIDNTEFDPGNSAKVDSCLRKYGPIIIGGRFGQLGPIKNLGHYIVVGGVGGTAAQPMLKILDPDKKAEAWVASYQVAAKWWDDDESAIVCDD